MASKAVLCTLFIAFLGLASASHFRYGTVTWTKNATDPQTVTFTLNMAMRRSYFGTPNTGTTVVDSATFYYGNGGYVSNPPLLVNNIDTALDVIYVTWTGTARFASAGAFTAYWTSCCRISTLQANRDYNYQVWTRVNLTPAEIAKTAAVNQSPKSSILPIIPVPYGQVPFEYQIDTTDIDGDSRVFRMATAAEMGQAGSVQPTGLSVSPTGLVTINSVLAQGLWATQQVFTDSFGNIGMVDYMLEVKPPVSYCNTTGGCSAPCQSSADCAQCGNAQSACINAQPRFVVDDLSSSAVPRTNRPTKARGAVVTMSPGDSLTLYYTADDSNLYKTATPVQIQFSSLPASMTRSAQQACVAANGCTYVGPYADPQFVSLSFNPTRADSGTYVVCASAKSMANSLPYAQHCITVVVSNITDVCGDGQVGVTEACDGGACCASDCKSFLSSSTTCRAASDVCERDTKCTGFASACPAASSFVAAGTVCRAAASFCDVAETCTGSAAACPANAFKSSSTVATRRRQGHRCHVPSLSRRLRCRRVLRRIFGRLLLLWCWRVLPRQLFCRQLDRLQSRRVLLRCR
eukprot:TRINITY_DN43_c0_g1_i5.p1 TRINITY_DN43_c0_g1~~TRINITY_DN43_c0_g1_i5.p1  ORF type:complete len:609 (-),score=107.43 TRINITY_DN43_c0_g1_i5:855-2585(-)